MNPCEIGAVVQNITYKKDWGFIFVPAINDRSFIQLEVKNAIDSVSRETCSWRSGKRYLSDFMCEQEIVGICFALIKEAEEHEMREFFRYKARSIFNPHLDPSKLADFASKRENFCYRSDSMEQA